jgi:hypothetical protein
VFCFFDLTASRTISCRQFRVVQFRYAPAVLRSFLQQHTATSFSHCCFFFVFLQTTTKKSMKASHLCLLFVAICVLFSAAVLAEPARATESSVRISIFLHGKRDDGGFLVRIMPTDNWDDLLMLARTRFNVENVCGVRDASDRPIQSMHDIFDNSEILFVPCATGAAPPAPPPAAAQAPAADAVHAAGTPYAGLPVVGRPRVPSRLPQPHAAPASPFTSPPPTAPPQQQQQYQPAPPTQRPLPLFGGGSGSVPPPPPSSFGGGAPAASVNPFAPSSVVQRPPPAAETEAMIRFVDDKGVNPVGVSWPADTYTGMDVELGRGRGEHRHSH